MKIQLKNIIRYLDAMSEVVIWQCDVYKGGPQENDPEKIFEGTIFEIPWYMTDFYLYNDENSEAISAREWFDDNGARKAGFIISVVEDEKYGSSVNPF